MEKKEETLGDCKVAQLGGGGARIQTKGVWPQSGALNYPVLACSPYKNRYGAGFGLVGQGEGHHLLISAQRV